MTIVNITIAQNGLVCSINFPDTLMLGHSMYFEYSIHNRSKKPTTLYYDPYGQNHNDLRRDESFTIKVFDSNKKLVPLKKSKQDEIIMISRRVGYHELQVGDSLVFTHWIDNWVDLDRPGNYTIQCTKEFRKLKKGKNEKQVSVECTKSFVVMAHDSIKLANNIHHIWLRATEFKEYPPLIQLNQTPKEFEDRRAQRTADYYYHENQLKLLCRLKSEQIIPYLDQIMTTSINTQHIQLAMEGLSKFNKNKDVFNILSKPFLYEELRFKSAVAREDLLEGILSNLKHSSIYYLSNFDDSLLVPFMLKYQNDNSYEVRLYIMQQLYKRNSQYCLENLLLNLNDNNATIRSEANRLLKMYELENKE
ncbi:MAG: hypothetical protein ACM3PT_12505 [Deltaproteobacteria bacterium]